ncbi:hypothetical protein RHMOL_Rhmol01G0160900 [Rhododendron molle]|uniref:Uncharacterized protein n=1 Tax=Rhododendron molle TaxID=49168 RepID=A0ACC0Q3W7_RHOML|nr:hypothetical protein RHMOL_Rhmol01G0160900 [Rhododendron molle]
MTKKSSSKRMSMIEIRAKWKALGDKAKQKYIEKAKLSSEAYKEQKVKVDPKENLKETFITRTQLKTTCDIIRNLEPQQVESVKAMGFGGLLRLKYSVFSTCCSILNIARRPKISFPLVHVGLHLVSYNGEMKRLGAGYIGLIKAVLESWQERERVVDQGKEIGQNIPMERFQGIEELNGILKKLASIMETMDVRGNKTNENSLAAKVSMDMKGTPSPVVNEKKGKKEPSFGSSTSPLTNKEKVRKEQLSGHLTSPLKANQEENIKKSSLSHLTSPLKTNKEQDMKEPKIKPSSKRSRKMATNIGDIMSSTIPPTIGMNKRQKKCQQEMPRTRLKGSQPGKKNADERTTLQPWNRLCNSLRFYVITEERVGCGEIINAVALQKTLIQRNNERVMKAQKLPIKRLKWLPVQEPDSDDCGVHTTKYLDLEQFNEEEVAKLVVAMVAADCHAPCLLLLSDQMANCYGDLLCYGTILDSFLLLLLFLLGVGGKDFAIFVHLCKIKQEGISLICSIFMTEIIC